MVWSKSRWNFVDVTLILFFSITAYLYIYLNTTPISRDEMKLEDERPQRIYFEIAFSLMAIPLYLRMMFVLSLSSYLGPLLKVITKMASSIFKLMFILVFILLAFASSFYGIFSGLKNSNEVVEGFNTNFESVKTTVRMNNIF